MKKNKTIIDAVREFGEAKEEFKRVIIKENNRLWDAFFDFIRNIYRQL